MDHKRRLVYVGFTVLLVVVLDQATKWLAIAYLKEGPIIPFPAGWYPNDLFHLRYAENTGAFLSLGSTLSAGIRFWLLTGLNVVILSVVAAIVIFKRRVATPTVLPLTLILAGGLGNLIDRIARDGVVVDFMNMGIAHVRTGVFNIADVAIMMGLFLLLFVEFFFPRREPAPDTPGQTEN
ncbi:MAG: signal peptidase II [Candidatus Hydrogenedentota bacterium]